jgi:DNA polymerase-3 subunit delta
MIITLSGENSFGWQAVLDELVAKFVAVNGDLALERIDGEEAELSSINESINSLPFLSSKKLVVLRSPSKNKSFQEGIEQILTNMPETTDVIIVEPKLDKRLTYYKYLKSNTEFREFNELDINGMASWVVARAKTIGGELGSSDARYLVERVGLNQSMLGNELDKLVLYSPKITRLTIDLLTEETPQSTIFQLLEAAFNGQKKKALKIYLEQRALKVEPIQIIAMLSWQLHILAVVKAAGERSANEIASSAKLSPFVVGKTQSIARSLSMGQIKTLIKDLLDIDIKTKTVSIDADEALQLYILKLAKN